MKALGKFLLLTVWLITATLAYGTLWSAHLDLFPSWPAWMARVVLFITQLDPTDTGTPEEFVTTYMLLVSFLNISLLTLSGWLAWRLIRRWRIRARRRMPSA